MDTSSGQLKTHTAGVVDITIGQPSTDTDTAENHWSGESPWNGETDIRSDNAPPALDGQHSISISTISDAGHYDNSAIDRKAFGGSWVAASQGQPASINDSDTGQHSGQTDNRLENVHSATDSKANGVSDVVENRGTCVPPTRKSRLSHTLTPPI